MTISIEPTADTFALIATARSAARRLWRDGYRFAKAGVIFVDLTPRVDLPASLFPTRDPEQSKRLMSALDTINQRFGSDSVRPGNIGPTPEWQMRRARLSPCYTTNPIDILTARACGSRLLDADGEQLER